MYSKRPPASISPSDPGSGALDVTAVTIPVAPRLLVKNSVESFIVNVPNPPIVTVLVSVTCVNVIVLSEKGVLPSVPLRWC
jgi:hypothetical protein